MFDVSPYPYTYFMQSEELARLLESEDMNRLKMEGLRKKLDAAQQTEGSTQKKVAIIFLLPKPATKVCTF